MNTKSSGEHNAKPSQICVEADACLRGEISCRELQRRIFPTLRSIAAARGTSQKSKMQDESGGSAEQKVGPQASDDSFAQECKAYEDSLLKSLRSLVQRLGDNADPLQEIYILGAQVFDDFYGAISDEEYDRLDIFRELAYEQAILVDADPNLKTAAAEVLRRRIRDAVSEYLRGTDSSPND